MHLVKAIIAYYVIIPIMSYASSEDHYELRTCQLRISLDSKKMCERTSNLQDIGYGFKHAYIGIIETNTCYDWGNWGYARNLSCNDTDIECCVHNSQVESNGTTSCASNISVFQDDWTKQVKKYKLLTWNCQRYANSLERFLKSCPIDATKSIEPCIAGTGISVSRKSLGPTTCFVVAFLLHFLIWRSY